MPQGAVGPRRFGGSRPRSAITVANEQVSIFYVVGLTGVSVPDEGIAGRSVKVLCPFGPVYHADGGHESALRLYADNNDAFCWSERQKYTPVSLWAAYTDQAAQEAAADLLDRVGYRALDVHQEWERVLSVTEPPSQDSLSEALKVYCARVDPEWEARQFDQDVAGLLAKCLALLPRVQTGDEAQQWLATCKTAMARKLTGDERS